MLIALLPILPTSKHLADVYYCTEQLEVLPSHNPLGLFDWIWPALLFLMHWVQR